MNVFLLVHDECQKVEVRADKEVIRVVTDDGRALLQGRHVDKPAGGDVVQKHWRHQELAEEEALLADAHVGEPCCLAGLQLDAHLCQLDGGQRSHVEVAFADQRDHFAKRHAASQMMPCEPKQMRRPVVFTYDMDFSRTAISVIHILTHYIDYETVHIHALEGHESLEDQTRKLVLQQHDVPQQARTRGKHVFSNRAG